jgi:protein PhnA
MTALTLDPPRSDESSDQVWLCSPCHGRLQDRPFASAEWRFLADSIWSEHPAVQVLSYRILRQMSGDPWADNLLAQIYLSDELQAWAEAGLKSEPVEGSSTVPTVDSNGTRLSQGDSVTLIKDLEVKGANFTAKRGTTVKNIHLTDDPKYVEGRVNGTTIVLVAAYLKKA